MLLTVTKMRKASEPNASTVATAIIQAPVVTSPVYPSPIASNRPVQRKPVTVTGDGQGINDELHAVGRQGPRIDRPQVAVDADG
jgi:hypothetical protein